MPLRLFVIRHGETEWSSSGQYTGRADIMLTEGGKVEAKALGERIREIDFSDVLVSPLRRAWQTCDLAGLGKQAKVQIDLAEWDNGDYQGLSPTEIRAKFPSWNLFRDGCPNGELPKQISHRVDRLISFLGQLDGNVALFTHGHLGRVLAARWIGLPIEFAEHFLFDTASLSILCFQHNQSAILLWNSSSLEKFGKMPTESPTTQVQTDGPNWRRQAIERWENEGGEILVPEVGILPTVSDLTIRLDADIPWHR